MYHYWRKCHSTHVLLEDEEKLLLKFITEEAQNIEEVPWPKLQSIQNRLKERRAKINMELPKPDRGIAVDCYCLGNPGPAGYRGIDLETGEVLFNTTLGVATNNIAEFLAIVHGLMYAKKFSKPNRIFSDSEIAIKWINKKLCGTRMESGLNPELENKIGRAERWLTEQKTYNEANKWFTNAWGENPADFGNK